MKLRDFGRRGKTYSAGTELTEAEWQLIHCEVQTKLAFRLELEERQADADRAWALAFTYWKSAMILLEAERQVMQWADEITELGGRMLCTEDLWRELDNGAAALV